MAASMRVILSASVACEAANEAIVAENVWTVSMRARKSLAERVMYCGGGAEVLSPAISDRAVGMGPEKTERPGEVSKERWRTVPEKAWKPQRSSGPTSPRETTTLFTSAVHPLNIHSIAGLGRSAKQTVPEVAVSNEVRPLHKRQLQVL